MINALPDMVLGFFVILCRIAGVFMLLPGFDSQRYPMMIRMLMAIAISLALTPYLQQFLGDVKAAMPATGLFAIVASEILVGVLFGFWGFLFMHAVRFAGTFIANAIGLSGIPGQPIDDVEATGPIASMLSLVTTALIFATDLHLLSIRAIAASYESLPLGMMPQVSWVSSHTLDMLRDTFVLSLQICSPFVVFAVVLNLSVGFTARFTPNLQLYFATVGLTTMVGFLLLMVAAPQAVTLALSAYGDWLRMGFQ